MTLCNNNPEYTLYVIIYARRIPWPPSAASEPSGQVSLPGPQVYSLAVGLALRSPADSSSFAVLRAYWLEAVHLAERPEARSTPCPCSRHCPSLLWKSLSVPQYRYNVHNLLLCVRVHHVPTPMVPVLRGGCLSVPLVGWAFGLGSWLGLQTGFVLPSTTSTCVTSPGKETRGSGLCVCQGLTAHVYKTLSHGLPTSSELRPLQTLSFFHTPRPQPFTVMAQFALCWCSDVYLCGFHLVHLSYLSAWEDVPHTSQEFHGLWLHP